MYKDSAQAQQNQILVRQIAPQDYKTFLVRDIPRNEYRRVLREINAIVEQQKNITFNQGGALCSK